MRLYIPDIPMPDLAAQEAIRERHQRLAKPVGGLGVLEVLSLRLAAMTGQLTLSFPRKTAVLIAADAPGTPSAAPALWAMAMGQSAVNALARQAGATLTLVDIGLTADLPKHPALHSYRVGRTRPMADGPALAITEVHDALTIGLNIASQEIANGLDIIAVGAVSGESATAAAAITAALLGVPPATLLAQPTAVAQIEQALAHNQPEAQDVLDVLRCVGSLEIAGMAGVILGAAAGRIPVVLDDFASATAALVAAELAFQVRPYLIAGHLTAVPGHAVALRRLGLRPLLQLDISQGQAIGALLAFHVVEAAARAVNETGEA